MEIKEKLSFLRKQHGMTQMELAERLDISRQTISKWECGAALPSAENLNGIGKVFNVSIDVLMDDGFEFQKNTAVAVAEKTDVIEERKKLNIPYLCALIIVVGALIAGISVCAVYLRDFEEPEASPIYQESMIPEYLDPSEVNDGVSGWTVKEE